MQTYLELGGFRRELKQTGEEVHGIEWLYQHRAERQGYRTGYLPIEMYRCNPRRALEEPEKFFSVKSYNSGMTDIRMISTCAYRNLNKIAANIDFSLMRKYVIKYYIIFRILGNPKFLIENHNYFRECRNEIKDAVERWLSLDHDPHGEEIFRFCDELFQSFGDAILKNLPKTGNS